MSQLDNLSPLDFEELCRDIASAKTGLSFSSFGPGPDGGVDGRHSTSEGDIVLQCKHYSKSTFASLKNSAEKERKKLDKLQPIRYLFATSKSLGPNQVDTLAEVFQPFLESTNDIYWKEVIEAALSEFPEIEKRHIKLWLSSVAVLERVLQSGLESYTNATKEEILEELAVYVANPSLNQAIEKLEAEKILVISGQPGVGKTTLAKMISYHYLQDGWKFVAIDSLEDGFASINNDQKTVFYFDDFLGRIELDKQTLLQKDNALSLFVNRVVKATNARFILTTRAHIFEEAKLISDRVDSKKFQLAKYLLDVGKYTRKVRSEILFNHLFVSNLEQKHFECLIEGDTLGKIIDHPNYNPRVIAFVSSEFKEGICPEEYPDYILEALDNPDLIWSKPFRSLNASSKHLLVTLYFQVTFFGVDIDELRSQFSELHRTVSSYYGQPTTSEDFDLSLRALESGFISISGRKVDFVNPSVSDYLKSFLRDKEFLGLLPDVAIKVKWAKKLWEHMKKVFREKDGLNYCASKFSNYAHRIGDSPTKLETLEGYYGYAGLSLSDRIEFLFDLWEYSKDIVFLEQALDLLESSRLEVDGGIDGRDFPELHCWVKENIEENSSISIRLSNAIEEKLRSILRNGVHIEELNIIIEAIDLYIPDKKELGIQGIIDFWVDYELTNTFESISDLDSESDLSDHITFLDDLSKLTNRNADAAKNVVFDRMTELEEDEGSYSESISQPHKRNEKGKDYTDEDIKSLFTNLLK
ncbi:ATP-binding protein [Vibrio parahaemolyticus]|uniref:ATP-binding protein n=1 Tax=Vibrio parahaemolyticus TaxID=670 RepID=UPI002362BF1D|nr:ATP-binding protein [Vibrio parahaemolyticus]